MGGDVHAELLDEISVDYEGRVVRHAFGESLVERQQMARGACIRKLTRGHQLPPARGIVRRKTGTPAQLKIISVRVGNYRRHVLRVAVRPRRAYTRSWPMTVAALKLHIRAICRPPNRLHMQLVIQFYRADVGLALFRCVEFRMAVLKATYAGRKMRFAALHQQICVARRTSLIRCRRQINLPAMLHMAFRAIRHPRLFRVMYRPVMTRQACRVSRLPAELSGCWHRA